MGHQTVTQAVVVPGTTSNFHMGSMQLALFNPDGTPFVAAVEIEKGSAVDDSTATDIADLVASFNNLLASLRNAGLLSESPG